MYALVNLPTGNVLDIDASPYEIATREMARAVEWLESPEFQNMDCGRSDAAAAAADALIDDCKQVRYVDGWASRDADGMRLGRSNMIVDLDAPPLLRHTADTRVGYAIAHGSIAEHGSIARAAFSAAVLAIRL